MGLPPNDPPAGALARNVGHFIRALRAAGVPVGTAQFHDCLRAVQRVGFTRREDFRATLRATLITRPEQFDTFEQLFALFWRTPDFVERMMEMMLPALQTMQAETAPPRPGQRRAAEGLAAALPRPPAPPSETQRPALEMDARASWSAEDRLRAMDFEQMSAAELAEATRAIHELVLPAPPLVTRRLGPALRGPRPDMAATLRRSMRRGGDLDRLLRRAPGTRPPNLVLLIDVSGSMATYARVLMHFAHALVWARNSGWGHVHAFTFGTRLTNITRALALRDVDAATATLGREVRDWEGGTRIGAALERFNRDWSRRVLGQGAVVLLITDGLERDDLDLLDHEAARLARSCRRLIWLNPLLRWRAFEPRAGGIRTLLPHVSALHPCHSLDSIADLCRALAGPAARRNG